MTTSATAPRRRRPNAPPRSVVAALPVAVVAVWPFVFHLPLVLAYRGHFQHVANDFVQLYYVYKPYLLAGLASGHVPLWMPQEASGFSFVLNPFTQALYPGNLLALPVGLVLGHWGPLEEQRFAVAALSLLAVSLYLVLRQIGLSVVPAALAAIVVTSSYKVTDILRFPNAVHAIAWAAVAVLAIVHLRTAHRRAVRLALAALLAFAVFCLATAGYPYYFAYFFLLLPPLLLWLELGAPDRYRARRSGFGVFAATTAAALAVAVVAVAPYLLGMRRLLEATTDRGGADFAFSTAHPFGWLDYLGSLVLPTRSLPEGWFYFGTAGVVLVCLALFVLARQGALRRYARQIAVMVVWIGAVMFFGLNAANPLFRVVWATVPGLDSLRVWPRINIFLVFPLAIVLGMALEVLAREHAAGRLRRDGQRLAVFAAFAAAGLVAVQLVLGWARPANSEVTLNLVPFYDVPGDREHIGLTVGVAVLFAAIALALTVWRGRESRARGAVLGLSALLVIVWVVQVHGAQPRSWMWVEPGAGADNHPPADLAVGDVSLAALAGQGVRSARNAPGAGAQFKPRAPWSTGVYANWHYRRYVRFLKDPAVDPAVKRRLLGMTANTRFFLLPDGAAGDLGRPRALAVEYYDGSRAVVRLESRTAGALVFADNWDRGWKATVDGRPAPIGLAFGTFKSVRVPRGLSRVELSYCPFSAPVYKALC